MTRSWKGRQHMGGVAIGIDLGTSGIRAALVDARRDLVAMTTAPIASAERSIPDAWWRALRQALEALAREASLADVEGIAVDGTSGTILPVDTAGRPLAPASLYNAGADPTDVARVARVAPPGSAARGASSPLARALAWRNLKGWAHLQHEADWLAGRLCGRFGLSDWNNALKTGYDPAVPGWPEWLDELDLDPAVLPEIVPPGQTIGRISLQVARLLGLPAAVRIVAGTTDGCAALLATGADQEGDGVTSLGTTLTLKILSPHPVLAPDHGIYSHRIGSLWVPGGASNTGGGALAKYFTPTQLGALSDRIDPAIVSASDFYPLPSAGERFPIADPALQPRETPRPADDVVFLHGLLESIARIEAAAYRRLADLGAPLVKRVYTVGGGARNPAWAAIRARVLGEAAPGVDMRPPRALEAAVGTAGLALAL
jgi:sugar (pentulose or hexulose) kinase